MSHYIGDIDPVLGPYHQWVESSTEPNIPADQIEAMMRREHGAICDLCDSLRSHSHASVIPYFISMFRLVVSTGKKDVLSISYASGTREVSLEYLEDGRAEEPYAAFVGPPHLAIPLLQGLLDHFVRRHKRLGKPNAPQRDQDG